MPTSGTAFDSPSEFKSPSDIVMRWETELDRATKKEDKARKRMAKTEGIFRDEERDSGKRFNILWSNTQILKPAIFSGTPKPDVRRRFDQRDELARTAAQIVERALEFSVDSQPFVETMEDVVEDYLVVGRGIPRVRFEPVFGRDEDIRVDLISEDIVGPFEEVTGTRFINPETGEVVEDEEVQQDEDGPFIMKPGDEEVVDEQVRIEYVPWDDFRMSPAKRWEDVRWVAFRTFLTRDELVDQFGKEKGEKVLLTEEAGTPVSERTGVTNDDEDEALGDPLNRAESWEIWDKDAREMIVISSGLKDEPLLKVDDPLKLTNFFPIPRPIYSVKGNRSLKPIPEYTLYQDQAQELDTLTTRINGLVDAMRVRGVGAGFAKTELEALFKAPENKVIPIENWDSLAERGGLSGIIDWIPIDAIASALQVAYTQRATLIQSIFEITGIADIFRGATDPNETLGAQRLKSQFGSLRIKPRQEAVQRMVRELFRMMAEIIGEHFSAETLQRMAGESIEADQDVDFDEVLALLRDDGERGFRIDIETDSTIAADEAQEKQDVTELFGAMGGFFAQIAPVAQTGVLGPEAGQVVKELLIFAMRKFRMGRKIEEIIEDSREEDQDVPPAPVPGEEGQPTGETPEESARADTDTQIKAAEMQGKQQVDQAEVIIKQKELELKERELALEERKEENRTTEKRLELDIKAAQGSAA